MLVGVVGVVRGSRGNEGRKGSRSSRLSEYLLAYAAPHPPLVTRQWVSSRSSRGLVVGMGVDGVVEKVGVLGLLGLLGLFGFLGLFLGSRSVGLVEYYGELELSGVLV